MTDRGDDKQTYIDLMSITEYGGAWNCGWYNDNFLETLERAMECCHAVELGDKDREFVASSPWQAAIWLLIRSILFADPSFCPDQRAALAKELGREDLGISITVFRGQRDPSWGFVPSIEQPHLSELQKDVAHCATRIFCNVVHDLYAGSGGQHLLPDAFTAIAQHYEMRTNLLDLTTDPSIAVFFANRGANKGDLVATYFTPLANVLNDVRIILPPAYAARLYRQRGFFIEVKRKEAEDLYERCSRVLFPADPDFIPHRRANNSSGDYRVLVLPGDRLLEEIKSEAESIAPKVLAQMKTEQKARDISTEIIQRKGFAKRFSSLESAMDEWLVGVEMFLSEIAIRRRIDGSNIIDVTDDVLDKVATDNLPIAHLLMRIAKARSTLLHEQQKDGELA